MATFLPSPIVYSIPLYGWTLVYTPSKSKLALPSLAAIVVLNFPPVRKSFSAYGACQSSDAWHHLVMCFGSDQNFQTFSTGALMRVSTVMAVLAAVSMIILFRVLISTTQQTYPMI